MLKTLLPYLLITTNCLLGTAILNSFHLVKPGMAQSNTASKDLSYQFYEQKISLEERVDQVAVKLNLNPVMTRGLSSEPAYLQLQQDLQRFATATTRGGPTLPNIEVSPLGDQYALISVAKTPEEQTDNPSSNNSTPSNSTTLESQLITQLQQSYIESTLPVLSRQGEQDSIVVTSEIVVSFEPDTTDSEAQALLEQYNLTVIRPLQFSRGRYLVSAPHATGNEIFAIANQLSTIATIQSATPNFVQSLPYQINHLEVLTVGEPPPNTDGLAMPTEISALVKSSPFAESLLPLQWYLNSESKKPHASSPRTDIHALEAWAKGADGDDINVAVIDSLIQWDHPDLVDNLYTLPEIADNRLPGEVSGWDFSNTQVTCDGVGTTSCALGDPDTRISKDELALVKPDFQKAIALPENELLAAYPGLNELLKSFLPNLTVSERADYIRRLIQNKISSEFHGTWSAGIIAANPQNKVGMVGVAPQANILPVRVFGLGGSITAASLIEAVGYAAAREVDVVNFSLGGLLPSQSFTDQLFDIIDNNPDLVIVASAGNSSVDGVSFPAAIPGVLSVGATSIEGNRAFYSSYGAGLDVVAPGGETTPRKENGMLTAGGTWIDSFWEGIAPPNKAWGPTLDPMGQYVQVQGTSFSAPVISGIMALMKSADSERSLSREQLVGMLQNASDYEALKITRADANEYRLQASVGFNTVVAPGFPRSRRSGIDTVAEPISAEQYFFGSGLVDAASAVEAVQQALNE